MFVDRGAWSVCDVHQCCIWNQLTVEWNVFWHRPTQWPCPRCHWSVSHALTHYNAPLDGIGKGFPYLLPSVGPRADPGVQAVSPHVTISHRPGGRLPLLSARPAVTFPATEHHSPLAGTKLYCLVTEAHRCEKLSQGCYAAFAPSRNWTHDLLITSPKLYPVWKVRLWVPMRMKQRTSAIKEKLISSWNTLSKTKLSVIK